MAVENIVLKERKRDEMHLAIDLISEK